ncbi:MAG: heavy metal-responsive transcriptional regulator [Steroidobacteraceae bacterium]
MLRIREAGKAVGMSADTLRYYEKIGLVPRPARAPGGQRTYAERDLARLRFVTRAQAIGFSLQEIKQLLRFREDPVKCSKRVRALAREKCVQLRAQQQALDQMERELTLLVNLCSGAADHCPILEKLEKG